MLEEPFEPFEALYARGMAYGASNIKTDTMVFSFRGEKFEFPTMKVHPFTEWTGYFYQIPVAKLRELAKEK